MAYFQEVKKWLLCNLPYSTRKNNILTIIYPENYW